MTGTAVAEPTTAKGSSKTLDQKRFLILGCGPAALIAAYTLEKHGVSRGRIEIISQRKEMSEINGAQFLHGPIQGDPLSPDGFINILHIGFKDAYASKVYGDGQMRTSFGRYESADPVAAWSLCSEYELLWDRFEELITEQEVTSEVLSYYLNSGVYTEIISTIPPAAYCDDPSHTFPFAPVLLGDPIDPLPVNNCIIYNGRPEDQWYRISRIFGEEGIEFGHGYEEKQGDKAGQLTDQVHLLVRDFVEGKKPLGTNCECGYRHPLTKLLRVGRFGMWDRRRLLHQVVSQVQAIL